MPFSHLTPNSKVNFISGNRNDLINTLQSNSSKFDFRAEGSSEFPIRFCERLDSETWSQPVPGRKPRPSPEGHRVVGPDGACRRHPHSAPTPPWSPPARAGPLPPPPLSVRLPRPMFRAAPQSQLQKQRREANALRMPARGPPRPLQTQTSQPCPGAVRPHFGSEGRFTPAPRGRAAGLTAACALRLFQERRRRAASAEGPRRRPGRRWPCALLQFPAPQKHSPPLLPLALPLGAAGGRGRRAARREAGAGTGRAVGRAVGRPLLPRMESPPLNLQEGSCPAPVFRPSGRGTRAAPTWPRPGVARCRLALSLPPHALHTAPQQAPLNEPACVPRRGLVGTPTPQVVRTAPPPFLHPMSSKLQGEQAW